MWSAAGNVKAQKLEVGKVVSPVIWRVDDVVLLFGIPFGVQRSRDLFPKRLGSMRTQRRQGFRRGC